jgi:hypothetical protein
LIARRRGGPYVVAVSCVGVNDTGFEGAYKASSDSKEHNSDDRYAD